MGPGNYITSFLNSDQTAERTMDHFKPQVERRCVILLTPFTMFVD